MVAFRGMGWILDALWHLAFDSASNFFSHFKSYFNNVDYGDAHSLAFSPIRYDVQRILHTRLSNA